MGDAAELFDRYGQSFEAGRVLYQEGDPADDVYVVHSGLARVYTTMRGLSKTLHECGPGAVFGETAIIVGRRREATAVAVEDSRILVIEQKTFEAMARSNAEIAIRLIRKLARRLDRTEREVRSLLYREPAARVASYLLDLSMDGPPEVAALAASLGLTKGEVEEILKRFVGVGLLEDGSEGMSVADPQELRRYLQYLELKERFGAL
jgi:CRP/FNR family cyclic AMP-dependent transcriptional regulator